MSKARDTLLQEVSLNPAHTPKMLHFIRHSVIYPDNQNCNFVFEVYFILALRCAQVLDLRLSDPLILRCIPSQSHFFL